MIQVCEEALKEFRQIYKDEFGVDLPDGEAVELASGLLNLFALFEEHEGDQNEN